jgi:hypothetical protein
VWHADSSEGIGSGVWVAISASAVDLKDLSGGTDLGGTFSGVGTGSGEFITVCTGSIWLDSLSLGAEVWSASLSVVDSS